MQGGSKQAQLVSVHHEGGMGLCYQEAELVWDGVEVVASTRGPQIGEAPRSSW